MQGGLFENMVPELASLCAIYINPKYLEPKFEFDRVGPKYEEGLGRLPMELWTDIVLRLAVLDILRFKLASKSLTDLIGNIIGFPGFAHEHLRLSLESCSSSPFLFFRDITSCHSIQLDQLEKYDLSMKVHHRLARGIAILGSCNGLLCILLDKSTILLYNPSTRERFVPSAAPMDMHVPQDVCRAHSTLIYGFGYNGASSDFNVLQLDAATAFSTMVYSLKNNAWTKVDSPPSFVQKLESDHGVLCSEALHWVAKLKDVTDGDLGVLAFHLHKQTYDLVPLPSVGSSPRSISVGSLDGCLCASLYVGASGVDSYQVHVMKEYGVNDSWSLLFQFSGNLNSITHMKPLLVTRKMEIKF